MSGVLERQKRTQAHTCVCTHTPTSHTHTHNMTYIYNVAHSAVLVLYTLNFDPFIYASHAHSDTLSLCYMVVKSPRP